jgi:hypothetical protein
MKESLFGIRSRTPLLETADINAVVGGGSPA